MRPFAIAPMMFRGAMYPVRRYAARSAPPAPKPDLVEQLRGLKTLQDEGALTPEEFELAKRKVLDHH
ncbi:SHOCT domain-containing protein [Solirubrobacter soli]|uniref:SHOCT domain-containing protein n=1 Tax=Solirubrobacter soli TaxID=363832 RepID=UPI0012FB4858|nr:SHOCT domain-containing protein [Solirubrobacter soli]